MIRSDFLALAVLAVVAGVAVGFWAAQRGRAALLPDPVPFSPVRDAQYWEFGFEAGPGQYFLELPSEDCGEAQALKEQFVKQAYPDAATSP